MKLIKQIAVAGVLMIGAFCAIMYSSCSKSNSSAPVNPCNSITCSNGGTCDSATASCHCATGYEGAHCDTLSRARFIKSWTATDYINGSTSPTLYTSIIAAAGGSDVTQVVITDFSDFFPNNPVTATVSGTTITIAYQNPDHNHYYVSGTGTFANNKISWSYVVKNDSSAQSFSGTGTWQ